MFMRLLIILGCLIVLSSLALTAAAAGSGNIGHVITQQMQINWWADHASGHDSRVFDLPGIGSGSVVCNNQSAYIEIIPNNDSAETDLWSVKYRRINSKLYPGLRTARERSAPECP